MMGEEETNGLERARSLTRLAAQWMELMKFRAQASAPAFSPSMSHYHDMLDPAATDPARLAACRTMRECVLRRAHVEDLDGEATYAGLRPVDPYRLHWRTTREGATLWMIGQLLTTAIESFEAALEVA